MINSNERMTYTAVNGILTDRDPALLKQYEPLVPMFELMQELFHILNDARRRRGSIDFDLNEAEVIIDEGGVVEAIIALHRNVAHRLIEEFMLLANETVASYLEAQDAPALYRDSRRTRRHESRASSRTSSPGFGYSLGAPLTALRPRHFQKLLERIEGKPEEKPIAFLMLRTMQKARYAPENLGHFGLAASSYTHFTSPIRRYPDLVVHRALRAARHATLSAEEREEQREELPEVARHTSEMERRADDAERELLQWKKVKFMADKVGDEFEGYITGVAAFGLFIELVEHFVEGHGARLDDGGRLLPVRRERAPAARREHAEDLPARRQGRRCRWCASTWTCARSIWDWSRFSSACGRERMGRGEAARRRNTSRAGSSGPAGVRDRSREEKSGGERYDLWSSEACLLSCRP